MALVNSEQLEKIQIQTQHVYELSAKIEAWVAEKNKILSKAQKHFSAIKGGWRNIWVEPRLY